MSRSRVRNEADVCITPEWVQVARISATAVRLYGVLNRIGQKKAHVVPSRKELAAAMHTSVSSVDRATRQLMNIGALTIKKRWSDDGEPLTNEYLLKLTPPAGGHVGELLDLIEDESPAQGVAAKTTPPTVKKDPTPGNDATPRESAGQEVAAESTPGGVKNGGSPESDAQDQDLKPTPRERANALSRAGSKKSNPETRQRQNAIWDELSRIFGAPKTPTERNMRGKVVRELLAAVDEEQLPTDRIADEITRKCRMFNARFGGGTSGAEVTQFALVKWWGQLGKPKIAGHYDKKDDELCPHGAPMWGVKRHGSIWCEDCGDRYLERAS